jgi:hypothetical protein
VEALLKQNPQACPAWSSGIIKIIKGNSLFQLKISLDDQYYIDFGGRIPD